MENLENVKRHARDLRKEEPRSPSEELAGFQLAARCLDKCRASLLGWQGDFMFNCPMDQQFFSTANIRAEDFKNFVATGATDKEVERWLDQKTGRQQAA